MAKQTEFPDYETLTNPKGRSAVPQHATGDTFLKDDKSEESRSAEVGWNSGLVSAGPDIQALKEPADAGLSNTRELLKRGHGLSFLGLLLFTTFVYFRPYEMFPSLTFLTYGAKWIAIATLIVFIPTQLALEGKLTIRLREVNLVLLLLLFGLLSLPLAVDKLRAWNSFVEYTKVIVMFIVMINVVRTQGRLKALLGLVLSATVLLSVLAVNDYRTGTLTLGGQRIAGAIGGLFDNPNDLALHLVTFFPIVVGMAFGARNLVGKLFLGLAAVLLIGGIVVTFSRGGFIGLISVVGVLLWRLGAGRRMVTGFAAIVLLGVFLLIVPGAYRERIADTSDSSAQSRKGELFQSIYVAVRNPLVGVGMNNFVIFSNTEHATHNSYTQVAAEMGLPAAGVYIWFLIVAIKRIRPLSTQKEVGKSSRRIRYLAIGIEASLIGYMVTSFFSSVAYLWYVYYLVGYGLCVTRFFAASSISDQNQTAPPVRNMLSS